MLAAWAEFQNDPGIMDHASWIANHNMEFLGGFLFPPEAIELGMT